MKERESKNAGSSCPISGGIGVSGTDSSTEKAKRRKSREKSLFVGLTVTGTARVSRAPGEWEV